MKKTTSTTARTSCCRKWIEANSYCRNRKIPPRHFFFSGGRSRIRWEKRLMVNSPKVATYDLQPEMSAHEVVGKIVPELENGTAICIPNFANPDMVGHTGDYDAIIKAVNGRSMHSRSCRGRSKDDYAFIIIADHGNAVCY